eukprot:m.235077 g.235077  ORF g.235077 m.235077 type:complete len:1764 (+) comp17396_c0_seq1:73-5364(+)
MYRMLLLLVTLAAAAQGRVSISQTAFTMNPDNSASVTFRLSEPIVCPSELTTTECAVVIELTNNAKQRLTVDNCWVKWEADEWAETRTIRIRTLENFANWGRTIDSIVTSAIISESQYYEGHNPSDIRVTIPARARPRPPVARGNGDPRYTTFDGARQDILQPGQFVFYGSPKDNFEAQVLTHSTPSFHCGLAARENGDLVIVYNCLGRRTLSRRCATQKCRNGGFPRVGRVGNNLYRIAFESGRVLSMSGLDTDFNIGVIAPGRDYEAGTYGIVGNFDGNRNNDLNLRLTPTIDLFNHVPRCCSSPPPPPPHLCPNYVQPAFIPPVLDNPDVEDITNLIDDINLGGDDDTPLIINMTDGESGTLPPAVMSRPNATTICNRVVRDSATARACVAAMPNFNLVPYMEDCIADLMLTGNLETAEDAFLAMEGDCRVAGSTDTSTWETDENGNPIAPDPNLGEALCPNACNSNGNCSTTGTCSCFDGYSGFDCAVNKAALPNVTALSRSICDTQNASRCPRKIQVSGGNYWRSANLSCRFTAVADSNDVMDTAAIFLSDGTLACDVPAKSHRGSPPLEYVVSVTTDGVGYSTQRVIFKYYDGICQTCTETTCGPNARSCTIAGTCFRDLQFNPDNACQVCQVAETASNWTFASQVNAKECAPRFDAESLQTSILDELTQGTQLICVSAANPLLASDDSYAVVYSLLTQTDDFTINPSTGCITASRTLDTGDSDIDVVLLVQGRDNQGAVANMTVIVDLQQSDSSPLFAADGYNFTVAEDAQVGSVVATVVATDAETNQLRYSWLTQDPAFVVNSSSGQIVVGQQLDFETKSQYLMLLRAQDTAGQFHITQVSINVTNVNEPPVEININASTVAENQPAGTVVGMLSAEDPEGGPFVFTVTSTSPFEVQGNFLVTTQPLNFEQTPNEYTVSVQCQDPDSLSYTSQLIIQVTNVNEAPTNIQLGRTNFSESFPVGELTTVSVTDDDNSINPTAQVVACSLADNNNGQFIIEDGILYLEHAFDFETAPTVQLTVVCADNGRPSRFSQPKTFTLTVTDANDGPEDIVFVPNGPVIETTPLNTVIGKVQAADYDTDASSVAFSFPDSDLFGLTGTVTCIPGAVRGRVCTQDVNIKSALDFERQPLERVRVFATDDNGGRTETTLTVEVTNGNDPVTGAVWENDDNVAMENVTVGTIVGELVVQDDDRDQTYNFTLLNGTDILELVVDDTDPSKVLVKVKDPAAFDYEQGEDSITFTIQISDDATPPEVTNVTQTIQLADEPLTASLDPSSYKTNLVIAEADGEQGKIIGVISTKGNDQALKVFPVLADNPYVGLKGNNLVLKQDLNFEDVNELFLNITFYDSTGPVSEPTTITVTIVDSLEPPEFEHDLYTAEISDDEATGTTVSVSPGPLVAVDPDAANLPVTLSINLAATDESIRQLFSLTEEGNLRLNTVPSTLKVEGGIHLLVITASEPGLPQTNVNVMVTVFDDCRDNLCISGEQCIDSGLSNYRCCDDGGSCLDKNGAILRNQQSSKSSKANNNAGLIAGVVVAVAILLVLCIFGFIYYQRTQASHKSIFDSSSGGIITSTNPTFRSPSVAASGQTVNDLSNPMYASFYRPDMSRAEATQELQGAPSGTFFVRDSQATPGWFVMGVRTDTEVRHEKIRCTETQQYQLVTGRVPEEPSFPSMPSLMNHYAQPQDAVPFVLRFQHNPGYETVANLGTALPADKQAPAVPLKQSQVAAVNQLAQVESQDIYSNTNDARVAMAAQATDA